MFYKIALSNVGLFHTRFAVYLYPEKIDNLKTSIESILKQLFSSEYEYIYAQCYYSFEVDEVAVGTNKSLPKLYKTAEEIAIDADALVGASLSEIVNEEFKNIENTILYIDVKRSNRQLVDYKIEECPLKTMLAKYEPDSVVKYVETVIQNWSVHDKLLYLRHLHIGKHPSKLTFIGHLNNFNKLENVE
jgi:hypothetical protein